MPDKEPAFEIQSSIQYQRRLLSLDSENYWKIWMEYSETVQTYCIRKLSCNQFEAEEITSNVMLKAYRKLPMAISKIENLKAWFIKMCINTFIDMYRSKKSYVKRCERYSLLSLEHQNQSTKNPIIELNQSEFYEAIQQAIETLSEKLRPVAIALFLEEKSHREVSVEQQCSEATIRKRKQLAREALRVQLRNYFEN